MEAEIPVHYTHSHLRRLASEFGLSGIVQLICWGCTATSFFVLHLIRIYIFYAKDNQATKLLFGLSGGRGEQGDENDV